MSGWYPERVSASPPTEQELKIPVDRLSPVRERLPAAGGELLAPSRLEVNVLFDTAAGEIAGAGRALRLRRVDDRWILTLKGPPVYRGAVKEREELETEVGSGETVTAILDRLGYRPAVRYEKMREVWRLHDLEVVLDHTPMGDFVEIEGPAGELEGAARELGLDPARSLAGSYVTLWERYRSARPELDLPRDMVFPT